jgi:hypothetical protein
VKLFTLLRGRLPKIIGCLLKSFGKLPKYMATSWNSSRLPRNEIEVVCHDFRQLRRGLKKHSCWHACDSTRRNIWQRSGRITFVFPGPTSEEWKHSGCRNAMIAGREPCVMICFVLRRQTPQASPPAPQHHHHDHDASHQQQLRPCNVPWN